MTANEPAARAAEGWCPHPEHGPLRREGGWGYCEACAGRWRTTQWPDWTVLHFRVTVSGGWLTRVLGPAAMLPGRHAGEAIERHVEQTHRDAAAGYPMEATP